MEVTPLASGHVRMLLGTFVLGVLPPDDERTVRTHLDQCDQCRAEYLELVDVPSWLNLLTESEAAEAVDNQPDEARLDRIIVDLAMRRRMAQRARRFAAVAAAAVVIATGIWGLTGRSSSAGASPPVAARYGARMNTGEGLISATVSLTPTSWGTQIQGTFDGVPLGLPCELVAIAPDGTRDVAASWTSDPTVTVPGAVPLTMSQITGFDLTTTDGDHILNIPVSGVSPSPST